MKQLLTITVMLSILVLSGCATEQQLYQEAKSECTMSGYEINQSQYTNGRGVHDYLCESKEVIRKRKFTDCSYDCNKAIDDYRDVNNIPDLTINCLKLCMGE